MVELYPVGDAKVYEFQEGTTEDKVFWLEVIMYDAFSVDNLDKFVNSIKTKNS